MMKWKFCLNDAIKNEKHDEIQALVSGVLETIKNVR
jgi:hypothetical protein